MTLIVGMQLAEGIAIAGDTRAVQLDPRSGAVVRAWDDIQKIYEVPRFVIGISGDVALCAELLVSLIRRSVQVRSGEFLGSDPRRAAEVVLADYEQLTKRGDYDPRPVGLMIGACEQSAAPRATPRRSMPAVVSFGIGGSLAASASVDAPNGMIVAVRLPAGQVDVVATDVPLFMGSGRLIDTHLENEIAIMLDAPETFVGRIHAALIGFSSIKQVVGDPTYNSLIHGIALDGRSLIPLTTCHDTSVDRYRDQVTFSSPWEIAPADELREDVLMLQADGPDRHWLEMIREDSPYQPWSLLDYRHKRKARLRNLAVEVLQHTVSGDALQGMTG